MAPHPQRALERLDLGRVLPPLVVPEVRILRAARDDQRVVWDWARRRQTIDRAQLHLVPIEVEVGDRCQHDADVAVSLEDRAKRKGDLAGRQSAGRHLVGQRLEQMEVATVDERHLERRPFKPFHRLETTVPSADHHYAMGARIARRADPSGRALRSLAGGRADQGLGA